MNILQFIRQSYYKTAKERAEMSKVEQMLLDFAKNELKNNPQLAGKFLQQLLAQNKVDPTLANDIVAFVEELLPVLLSSIK